MPDGEYVDTINLPPSKTRTELGQKVEPMVIESVAKKYGVNIPGKSSSKNGLDIPVSIPGVADFGEVKPANAQGVRDFWKQLDQWTKDGLVKPGQKVALFIYDELGRVYKYGVFTAQ